MRIKNTLRNSLNSICCYFMTTLFLFISRKLFLNAINIEFLGLEGIFKDVLAFISLADLGAEGAITYKMYQAVAQGKSDEILKLMQIYKYIYRIIAGGYFIVGIIVIPFFPILITETSLNYIYICIVYILQLSGSISSYFFGYYRVRFQAEQKEYISIKADMWAVLLGQMLRIIILLFIPNYLLYVMVTTVQNVTANLIIAWYYMREFGIKKEVKISKKDFRKLNILTDIKNYIPYNLASTIYGATDNMVISATLGVSKVALFTNYTLIINQISLVFNKLFTPLRSGIANLVYSGEIEKGKRIFFSLDMFFFMVGCYLCSSVFTIIQPFMSLWLGDIFLQDLNFVGLLVLNLYIVWAEKVVSFFRGALGNFELDKGSMILSAILNITISIILAQKFGFSGIIVGTIIGHMIIWSARIKVVFNVYLKEEKRTYLISHVFKMFLAFGECSLVYCLTYKLPVTWYGIIIRGIIVFLLINGINILFFCRTSEFSVLVEYVCKILRIKDKNNG